MSLFQLLWVKALVAVFINNNYSTFHYQRLVLRFCNDGFNYESRFLHLNNCPSFQSHEFLFIPNCLCPFQQSLQIAYNGNAIYTSRNVGEKLVQFTRWVRCPFWPLVWLGYKMDYHWVISKVVSNFGQQLVCCKAIKKGVERQRRVGKG